VKGIVRFAAMTLAGGIGWWLGAFVGIMTAVVVSAIASGVGLWLAMKLEDEWGF
jgi:hypothetical protein